MCPHMILQGPGRAKAPSGRTVVAGQLESTSHGRTSRWPDQRLRPRLDAGCAPESLVEGGHRRLRLARSLAPGVPPITISRTVAALAWLAACFVSGRRVRGGKGTGSSGGRRLRIGRDGVGVAAGAAVAVVVGSAGIPTANGSRVRLRSPTCGTSPSGRAPSGELKALRRDSADWRGQKAGLTTWSRSVRAADADPWRCSHAGH